MLAAVEAQKFFSSACNIDHVMIADLHSQSSNTTPISDMFFKKKLSQCRHSIDFPIAHFFMHFYFLNRLCSGYLISSCCSASGLTNSPLWGIHCVGTPFTWSQSCKPCRPWLLRERCGPEDRKQLERSPAVKAVVVQRIGWEKRGFPHMVLGLSSKVSSAYLLVQHMNT